VHKLEVAGTALALLGCVITVQDQEASKVDLEKQNLLLGDFLGILSSISNGFFLAWFSQLMLRVPSITAISIQAAECGLIIAILGLTFFPASFTFDLHWETGVFGFLSADQVVYIILVVGFFTGSS
jgi:hypothetical protein